MSFQVQVCEDASIILMEYPGVVHTNSYEILLGQHNTQTLVYDTPGGELLQSVNTLSILSCAEVREFWISWEGLQLEMGGGPTNGQSRFLSYDMTSKVIDVRSVAFATGQQHEGTWELKRTNGQCRDL